MISALFTSCHSSREAVSEPELGAAIGWKAAKDDGSKPSRLKGQGTAVVAMAQIYKTNGDYDAYVPVTLNAARNSLISYPAPSDVVGAQPVKLDGGYLLDRRGVGASTAFTRWTYEEYAKFPAAPSAEEIMKNLQERARVVEIYRMPFAAGTPDAPALCNHLIASGLPDCPLVYSVRRL